MGEAGIARPVRLQHGKSLRRKVQRTSWAKFERPPGSGALDILEHQSRSRVKRLRAIRRGRMVESPFAFYRGAAAVMAHDLAGRPTTGLKLQICGDAHLMNFGGFATPERHLIFDLNDFDETFPGPWEWDLERLVASVVVAGRQQGLSKTQRRECAMAASRTYRSNLRNFSGAPYLEVWYRAMPAEEILERAPADRRARLKRVVEKARANTSRSVFPKLVHETQGRLKIRDEPPLLTHTGLSHPEFEAEDVVARYRRSLPSPRRALLDRYSMIDAAMKVVGVGSVGTRCYVVLFIGDDEADPLFLQVKEASESVIAQSLGIKSSENQGARVVRGQRLLQAAGDVLLGWTRANGRDFYVRQLRDMKASADIDRMDAEALQYYAELCGGTLARAHARSGPFAEIAGYVGGSETLDEALADFGEAYADQNERDHAELARAIRRGKLAAERLH